MEIISVIFFGGYSMFVLNTDVGEYIKLNTFFTTLILCVLYVASGYFTINGITEFNLLNVVIGSVLLWSMKLFKF